MKLNTTVFRRVFTLLVMTSTIITLGFAQTAVQSYQGHDAAANEVLIKFEQAAADDAQGQAKITADIQQAQLTANIDVARTVGSAGWLRLHSRSYDVATLMSMLNGASSVVHVEPNWAVEPITTPDDPDFPSQWGLQNTGQTIVGVAGTPGADIGAVPAWSISTGSRSVLVGLVDTGISYTHPDLAANVWSAQTDYGFMQGTTEYTCPAGTHGFNVISNTCDPAETDTTNGHGTSTSGVIGAVGNNDIGIAGTNWTTSIITCVLWTPSSGGTVADAVNCLQYMEGVKCYFGGRGGSANIRVLNNSYGGCGFSQPFLDEIDNTYTADMLFVAAAGNGGTDNDTTPYYPASYSAPNVISVAAFDNRDYLASTALNPSDGFNSNYGPNSVHLGGPGVNVLSTFPGGYYENFSGTSEAAPHVSGTGALSLSLCLGDTDWLAPNILNNVVKTSALTGMTITGGRVNAYNSVYAASQACPGTGDGYVYGTEQSTWYYQGGQKIYIYDSGTVSLTVNGATKTVSYTQSYNNTAYSLANTLEGMINGDSSYPVRAHLLHTGLTSSYAWLELSAKTTGSGTCYTTSASYTWNTQYFSSPSFQIGLSGSALTGCK
jgi:subtilisin family serine protease